MKKKIGLFFCILFGLCAIGGGCFLSGGIHSNVNYAVMYAEEETPAEPEFVEKVYSYSDEQGNARITLTSETEFKIETQQMGGDLEVRTGTYVKEGTTLTLKVGENELKVTVDDINNTFGPYVEVFECKVVLGEFKHGEIEMDRNEGHVGDIVTLNVKPTLLYLIEYVKVNGVNLVEDENTKGLYTFVLVEGENKIEAKFAVDKELLGEMSVVYEQALNKDWTNLFSLENVLRIVAFILNGGILIVIVRYFIQDKKIATGVERGVKETMNKILPETTKQVVLENTKTVLQPMFTEITGYQNEIIRVVGILVKCMALMQEDTPEARQAILNELANLNIGDMKVIEEAKKFIDEYFGNKMAEMKDVMDSLDGIINQNKETAQKVEEILENNNNGENSDSDEAPKDNGVQI